MSGNPLADDVWRAMASVVLDNRDSWKRAVVERTGSAVQPDPDTQPAGPRPMTVKQVAHAATIDAPAATVAVNDLEEPRPGGPRDRPGQPALQDGVADGCGP